MKSIQSRIFNLFLFILILGLLLTACYPVMPIGGPEEGAQQSQGESMTESKPGDLAEEGPSIMEGREAVGEGGSIYHVPCAALETLEYADPYVVGDSLLFAQVIYDENNAGRSCRMGVHLRSPADAGKGICAQP